MCIWHRVAAPKKRERCVESLAATIVLVSLASLVASCVFRGDEILGRALVEAIEKQKEGHDAGPIVLRNITSFEWDRAYFFGAYTPVETIDKQLGFTWAEAARTRIYEREDVSLVVFTKDMEVVRFVELKRSVADVSIGLEDGLSPVEAVLEVGINDLGKPELVRADDGTE